MHLKHFHSAIQIEIHLRYQQPAKIQFCKENNIVVTSYGSLGSPGRKQNQDGIR